MCQLWMQLPWWRVPRTVFYIDLLKGTICLEREEQWITHELLYIDLRYSGSYALASLLSMPLFPTQSVEYVA
jgi:hypothetical protein